MENRLKFRVWSKQINRWISKEEWYFDFDGNIHFIDLCPESTGGKCSPIIDQNLFIIQQWTGLKDKNGKEIFEGDIVKEEFKASCANFDGREIICLPGNYFKNKFDIFVIKRDKNEITRLYFDRPNHIGIISDIKQTVIGNIYESPELLK